PVREGEGVTLTATLAEALDPARAVTIPLAYAYGTAGAGDVTKVASIAVASGGTTGTAVVQTVQDTDHEDPDETFTVSFGTLPAGLGPGTETSVEIAIDDAADAPVAVSLSAAPNPVREGEGVTLTATLAKALDPARAVTVPVLYSYGTAEAGDVTEVAGITISAGETRGAVALDTADDAGYEAQDRTFTVKLAPLPAELAAGAAPSVAVAITDGPYRMPSLRFEQGTAVAREGDGRAQVASILKDGDARAALDFEIRADVANHAWLGGVFVSDAPASTQTESSWTFARKADRVDLGMLVRQDDVDQPSETVAVAIKTPVSDSPEHGVGSPGTVHVRFVDDDPTTVGLEFTDLADKGIEEGDPDATVALTLSLGRALAAGEVAEIPLVLSSASGALLPGQAGALFRLAAVEGRGVSVSGRGGAAPTVFLEGDGSQQAILTFASTGLRDADGTDERVRVSIGDVAARHLATNLDGGVAYLGASNAAKEFTVKDTAAAGIVLTADVATVAESAARRVTVTAAIADGNAFPDDAEVAVSVGAAGDGAVSGVDYRPVKGFGIVIPAGRTSAAGAFTLAPIDDRLDEDGESISVTGSGAAPATITLADDDDPPVLSVSASPASEGAADAAVVFRVALGRASGRDVKVDFALHTDSTATSGADHAALTPGTLTFAPGQTGKTVRVPLKDDSLDEASETLVLELSSPVNATFPGGQGTLRAIGVIADDDALPTVTVLDDGGGVEEPSSPGASGLVYKVQLSAASGRPVTVPYTLGGDAVPGADYEIPVPASVTIPAGKTVANLVMLVKFDRLSESSESIVVTLGAPANAVLGATRSATKSIINRRFDASAGIIDLATDVTSVAEGAGQAASVTVTATVFRVGDGTGANAPTTFGEDVELKVYFGLSGHWSTASVADYVRPDPLTITIPAGETSASGTVSLEPIDDSIDEHEEIISVATSGGTTGNSRIQVNGASIRIVDDDAEPVLSFGTAGLQGQEGHGGNAQPVHVVLAPASGKPVTVDYADTRTGSATPDRDYAALPPGKLTFAPGQTRKPIPVTVYGDRAREPDETIVLRLSNPANAGFAGGAGTLDAKKTILNDDLTGGMALSVDLDPETPGAQAAIAENRSATATVTAALESGIVFSEAKEVTVKIGAAGDSAVSGTDYAPVAD
ncbi:MAG: hypothetical protein F4127_03400, partial [Gammaproteobacteria bacterium]|nr:hypothetical protein [Gammaproteobacteria bacterium]